MEPPIWLKNGSKSNLWNPRDQELVIWLKNIRTIDHLNRHLLVLNYIDQSFYQLE